MKETVILDADTGLKLVIRSESGQTFYVRAELGAKVSPEVIISAFDDVLTFQMQGCDLPKKSRRSRVEGCAFCARYKPNEMCPPHDASERCESGKNPHCTCDTCF